MPARKRCSCLNLVKSLALKPRRRQRHERRCLSYPRAPMVPRSPAWFDQVRTGPRDFTSWRRSCARRSHWPRCSKRRGPGGAGRLDPRPAAAGAREGRRRDPGLRASLPRGSAGSSPTDRGLAWQRDGDWRVGRLYPSVAPPSSPPP